MRGREEAKAYTDGERQDYKVTVPATVDVKSTRDGLKMTQPSPRLMRNDQGYLEVTETGDPLTPEMVKEAAEDEAF